MNASPNRIPAEIALCEQGPEGVRLAILGLGTDHLRYLTQPGGPVKNLAWSPDGQWLAYWQSGDVSLLNIDANEHRSVVAQPIEGMPCARCFSDDSRYLATLLPKRIVVTDVSGQSMTLEVPEAAEPYELLWSAGAKQLLVLARTKTRGRELIRVDVPGRRISSVEPSRFQHLLGWRQGNLLVEQEGDDGNQVGGVSGSGVFQLLRTDEPVGDEFYLEYLANTDQLILTVAREHSGDPVQMFLTAPGLNGAARWLSKMSFVGEMRFSRDEKWVVFTDKSRPELFDAFGGDLYLGAVGNDAPVLLRKAEPGGMSYIAGASRP